MEAGTTVQITMPEMGESVTEGTILEWLKQVGDEVEAEEGIVEVSTDKVDTEVPAPAAGILTKILVEPDDVLVRPDGSRRLRRIRTGHQRSTEATYPCCSCLAGPFSSKPAMGFAWSRWLGTRNAPTVCR